MSRLHYLTPSLALDYEKALDAMADELASQKDTAIVSEEVRALHALVQVYREQFNVRHERVKGVLKAYHRTVSGVAKPNELSRALEDFNAGCRVGSGSR